MDSQESAFVLGQRYTFATLALVVALLSFLNLLGLEKSIVAVVLGALLLDEGITLQMLAAGALILVSVALIARKSGAVLAPGRGLRRRSAVPAEASSRT